MPEAGRRTAEQGAKMRYLVAMLFAALGAAVAMLFVSGRLASAIVARFAFDNPDQVADFHAALFMGANVAALALGWVVGWALGGLVLGRDENGS